MISAISTMLAARLFLITLLISASGHRVRSAGVKSSHKSLDNFEPIDFSAEEVKKQHENVKLWNSRKNEEFSQEDLISTQNQRHISIRFKGYGRVFILKLSPDTSALHPNVEFNIIDENGKRPASYDPSTLYTGRVLGDADSYVHGHVLQSGLFDGIIHAFDATFHLEPASRFLSKPSFHSLLYRYSDVSEDLRNVNVNKCDYEKHLKKLEEQYWPSAPGSINGSVFNPVGNERRRLRRNNFLDTPICPVYLAADHTFFQSVVGNNDETQSITELVTHLNEANQIYTRTDFNGDGSRDNVGFALARVDVFTSPNAAGYLLGGTFTDSGEYLDVWSQYNHASFCLALLFGYRELNNGVLGLAWVGGSSSAGICANNVGTNSGPRSRNTGIVTLLNFGQRQPRAVSTITVAHEWGHNFGTLHDPENDIVCAPGEFGLSSGNFLMYSRATDGTQINNNRFSTCSTAAILPVLEGRSGCFLATTAVCGNGIVEGDEECDCGSAESCQDPCCVPLNGENVMNPEPCRFVSGGECSPNSATGSVCCNSDCSFVAGGDTRLCEAATSCTDSSFCNGTSAMCPEPNSFPDGMNCSDTQTCQGGDCVGSICASTENHTTECQCTARAQLCHVCCQSGQDGTTCTSISQLPGFGTLFREAGRSCSNFRGYCTTEHVCDLVDNNSVLNSLLNLFSLENALLFKDWLAQYWYIPVIIVIAIIILAILLHVTYRKKKKDIKEVANNTMHRARNTLGRRGDQPEAQNRRRNRSHRIRKMLPQQALTRLKRFFPTVGLDTLKDVMVTSRSEEAAVERLLEAGYPLFRVDPNAQQSN